MNKRLGVAVVIVALVAVVVFVVVRSRGGSDERSRAPARRGSAQVAPNHAVKPARTQPARAIVTVTGPAGPLEHAVVRLARDIGDVATVQTGSDGVARSEDLEPGTWTISASATGHEPAALAPRDLHAGETADIELTLAAGGRTLRGLVTDATGGPIAGARIDAAKLGSMARPSDAVATTLTANDGSYSLSVAEGQLLVAASEPSYAPQSRYVEVGASGATANFQLVPGGVIEGIVRDERTREPVAGAIVDAARDAPAMLLGERSRQRAVTASDGRFRIAGLRPGAFDLTARAGPLMSRAKATIGLGVAEQITDVEILIAGAPSIRGVVIDEHGAPAAGVDVAAFASGGRGDELEATSDATGTFAIEGVQPGRYMLMGRSASYLAAGTTRVEVGADDVEGVKVNVRRGERIVGHVEPRQICDVQLELDDVGAMHEMMFFAPKTTAPDGNFELGPAKPSTYRVDARCPSGAQGTKTVTVASGLGDLVVEVKPGASIAGRVVDGSGKPIAAVTVIASLLGETERTTIVNGMVTSGIQALANGRGEFELRGLAAGTYRLGVLERGRPLPMKSEAPHVAVKAGEHETGVTLAVDRPDGVIRGVVTGPDGKPLPDAWVSLHVGIEDLLAAPEAREERGSGMVRVEAHDDDSGDAGAIAPVLTDAAGRFEIGGLARLPMTVIAEAQGGALRGQAMRVVPDANITIQARGLTELRGTVRGSGGPPPWFTVQLDGPTREQRSFATGDGTFSFARVEPGRYRVTVVSAAGSGEATVEVTGGSPASVAITLVASATVVGKLVDAAGAPLGGLPIAIIPDAGDGSMRVQLEGPPPTSSPDGSFRVEAKPGKSVLLVMTPPRPTTRPGLVLEAGKTLDVGAITVTRGGAGSGAP